MKKVHKEYTELKEYMLLRSISYRDVVGYIDMSLDGFCRKINGSRVMTLDDVTQISLCLNLSSDDILDLFFPDFIRFKEKTVKEYCQYSPYTTCRKRSCKDCKYFSTAYVLATS